MESPSIQLTHPEEQRLLTLLGGPENLTIQYESEFLEQTGCPANKLELWLEDAWIQCDIRAVLTGSESAGPEPVLLRRRDQNQSAMRLFYPKKELLIQNAAAEGLDHMGAIIAARPWPEAAEEIISQVDALTLACTARDLATIEIKLFWKALWIAICALVKMRREVQVTEMCRLVASMQALAAACQQRGGDRSPQARYSEALLNSRRSLSEHHNSVLDGFQELVEIARTISSHEVAEYVTGEVGLRYDDYLDAVQMMARDRCNPAEVANPPARVRLALIRKQHRKEQWERQRYMAFTEEQESGLMQPAQIEDEAIAKIDWERGKATLELPEDQTRAVEAKMDGLDLQASEARDELGWDAARVAAVRRSLEPDRRLGWKLRRHFAAYKRAR
jgi:hypothetical protein